MIWVGGEIVPDDALKISVLDRTFEHGLGLFETFRTWNGRAVLLDRHLERMRTSAKRLRLPLDESALPDPSAVAALHASKGFEGDALYRITMSGGISEEGGSTVWMTARLLPPPPPPEGVELVLRGIAADRHDPLAGFKTLNYWHRRIAADRALSVHREGEGLSSAPPGSREALLMSPDGLVWEGSRTNIFAVLGDSLLTPGRPGPFVPGIMRDIVLEQSPALGLPAQTKNLTLDCLRTADEVFLTNSVRGIIPVRAVDGREFEAPGPWTKTLQDDIWGWLNRGEDTR